MSKGFLVDPGKLPDFPQLVTILPATIEFNEHRDHGFH